MLEFSYDGYAHTITAISNCILDYALVGGGGGGGGNDAYRTGSYGLPGDRQLGQVYLLAGQSLRCIVGSGGQPGQSDVTGGGGGAGGYSLYLWLGGWCGGTGGNAGGSGSSGAGGGGGGATILQYVDGTTICAAAGGGGGGGAGVNSNGFIKSYTSYLGVTPSYESGGKGQDKRGDGGGAGGGGGGAPSGAGGTEPTADYGAMSGSSGFSYNLYNQYNQTFYTSLGYYNPWILAGLGGANGQAGANGYAIFSSKQTDINIKRDGAWTKPQYISVRSNNAWTEVAEAYVKSNGSWVRVYGNNTPTTSTEIVSLSNVTGPMIPYPPPIVVPVYEYSRGTRGGGGYVSNPNAGTVTGGWGYGNDRGGTDPSPPGPGDPGPGNPSA